jgi:GNAT superfamily N-acetyltransferase
MRLAIRQATAADVADLLLLQRLVSEDITRKFGKGPWTPYGTERGVLRRIIDSHVLIGRRGKRLVATLALQKKKPWAIDVSYFSRVASCQYLLNMAVVPDLQGQGLGRRMLVAADRVARERGAQVIRLDAFDSPAGAGDFYARCGYRETGRAVFRGTPLVYFERLL